MLFKQALIQVLQFKFSLLHMSDIFKSKNFPTDITMYSFRVHVQKSRKRRAINIDVIISILDMFVF